jgi:hypothetical protein
MNDEKIKSILNDALKVEIEKEYTTSARGSNLPVCKLDLILHHFSKKHGTLPKTKTSFKTKYYLDIGNALHDLFQEWLTYAYAGKIFANWKCPVCGEETTGFGPVYCAKCDEYYKYEEIEISDRGFSGHVDMIIDLFDDGTLWVIDFKFLTKPEKDSVWTYELQVNSYMTVLKDMGFPIVGGMVWHFCREKPFDFEKARFYSIDHCPEVHESFIQELKDAEKFIEYPDYNSIPEGICTSDKDVEGMHCLWGKVCGSPCAKSLVKNIITGQK